MEGKKRRPHGNREHNISVRRGRHFWNEGSGFASAIASRNIPCIWDVEARFFIAQRRKSKGSAEEHLFSNQFTTMFPILRDNDIARELIFSKFDSVSKLTNSLLLSTDFGVTTCAFNRHSSRSQKIYVQIPCPWLSANLEILVWRKLNLLHQDSITWHWKHHYGERWHQL